MEQPLTPELDRQKLARDKGHSQVIGEFLDWLGARAVVLAQYHEDGDDLYELLVPVGKNIEQWLAEYFEIDLNKIEKERQALLDYVRSKP